MVQFDSVDPAALVVAIIAIIVSFEQLGRAAFDSQITDLRRIVIYLTVTDGGSSSQKHIEQINDSELLLLIDNGLTTFNFLKHGTHPASWGILRMWPSSIFMGLQVWCIRRNLGIGSFIVYAMGYIFGFLLWAYYQIIKRAGHLEWRQGRWWVWNTPNKNHCSGYTGKQYDRCIENLVRKLGWATPDSVIKSLQCVAWLASRAASDYTGPCLSSEIACCQKPSIGALLCDINLLNPNGPLGKRIYISSPLKCVAVTNHGQSFEVDLPKIEILPGISRIIDYHKSFNAKDKGHYERFISVLFNKVENVHLLEDVSPVWCEECSNCESKLHGACIWRGRPILILTFSEFISMVSTGNLHHKKCLIVDFEDKTHVEQILQKSGYCVDLVIEQNDYICNVIQRVMDRPFVVLAKTMPHHIQLN